MANSLPWSVRGIDPDIREQAVDAAHRNGMSVGQWLNQVLAGNLDDDEIEDQRPAPRMRKSRPAPRRVEDLSERLDRLSGRSTATSAQRGMDDANNERILDLLESTVQAVERLEKNPGRVAPTNKAVEQASPTTRALEEIERRLDLLTQRQPLGARAAQPMARGLDHDPEFTRALAEIEARRRDLDAGPAGRPMAAAPVSRAPEQPDPHLEAMRHQLDQLIGRIDEMRAAPKPDSGRLQDRLDQIVGKIDEWRARPQEDMTPMIAPMRRDLANLAGAIEALAPQRLVGMVESAVAGVAEKSFRASAEALPKRLQAPLEQIQDDVREILREVSNSHMSDRISKEIGLMSSRLDEIGRGTTDLTCFDDLVRLEDIARESEAIKAIVQQAVSTQPLDALAREIEALGHKIETFRDDPRPFNDRPVLDALQALREQVDGINPKQVLATIEGRLSAISVIEERMGAMAGIEAKLGEIARDVSKLAKDAKPLPQLDSIAERLERIDRALDSAQGQPLAGIDQLVEKLDRIGTTLTPPAQTGEHEALVGLLNQLSSKIDQAQNASQDTSALDGLQAHLERLTSQMEQAAPQQPGLEGLERSMRDIFAQLEMVRMDVKDVTETAVERVAQEANKAAPRGLDTPDTLAAEGLLLIKRDLGEFKNAQSEAERRTRQTLEALHETLNALVSRLSQMEAQPAMRASAPSVQTQPAPHQPVAPAAPAASPMMPAAAPAPQAQPKAAMSPKMPEPQRHTPQNTLSDPPIGDDFNDLPLEPGMRPGAPGEAPRIMASEPGLSADPKSNFIAAARRAAQAAAEKSQTALQEAEAPKRGRRQDVPGMGKAASTGTSLLARSRRPILLGVAALLFGLLAVKVSTNYLGKPMKDMPSPQMQVEPPATPEQNTPPAGRSDNTEMGKKGDLSAMQPMPGKSDPSATQTIPSISTERIASANPNALPPPIMPGKRTQRLSEMTPGAQVDPVIVGSIGADGDARPLETGRQALVELMAQGPIKGADSLNQMAVSGNSAAIFEVGARYADGRGVQRDPKLAAKWFEQGAISGHAPSQYRLASLYREGRGVAKDPSLAFQWYDRAAAQGHILAMHNAAVLLAEGVHGTPDYAGAALWFKRAAEYGVKDSQFNVAILFARGLGVNQDLNEAFRWFSIAAESGDQDAAKKRDDIAARLSKDQLAKERARLKTFAVQKANPAVNEPGNWEAQKAADQPRVKTSQVR